MNLSVLLENRLHQLAHVPLHVLWIERLLAVGVNLLESGHVTKPPSVNTQRAQEVAASIQILHCGMDQRRLCVRVANGEIHLRQMRRLVRLSAAGFKEQRLGNTLMNP